MMSLFDPEEGMLKIKVFHNWNEEGEPFHTWKYKLVREVVKWCDEESAEYRLEEIKHQKEIRKQKLKAALMNRRYKILGGGTYKG